MLTAAATTTTTKGDMRMLTAARQEARKRFDDNRHLSSDSEEATTGIAQAEDAARILKHNVVQGLQAGKGTQQYSMFGD